MKLFHRLTPLGLVLVASASLIAQEGTGTLVGTVRGDGGKVLAGARIIIASPNMLQTRVISTNEKGEFRVPLLPPSSNYTVTVTADGYVSRKADGLTIPAGGTIRQDLNLKSIASAGASVEVVAISSSVDKTETKIVSTYTEEALQNLPTGNLNSYGALAVSPGVSGSVGYPVIRGGITGESQFMVNGISVRDPLVRQGRQFEKVIDDLTQDVQVILSPMNAKYGFTSAGITNIVTKRGSNEFEGSVRAKLRNSAWAAGVHETPVRPDNGVYSNTTNMSSYTSPVEDTTTRTYEVTLLGPIWKDHLTFAYAGRFNPPSVGTASLPNLFSSNIQFVPYPAAGAAAYTFGQVDTTPYVAGGIQQTLTQQYKFFWQINRDQTLSWDATVDKLGPQYFAYSFAGIDPAKGNFQTSDRNMRGLSYNAVFGSTVVDIRWGSNKSEVQFSKGPGDPINVGYWKPTATSVFDQTAGAFSTSYLTNGDPGRDKEKRNSQTLDANIQHIWGNHTLDLGFSQMKEITFAGGYPGMNGVQYYVPGRVATGEYVVFNVAGNPLADPNLNQASNALWRTTARVPQAFVSSTSGAVGTPPDNTDTSQGFYINDLYTLNNHWSFMGGLRYERYLVDNRSGRMASSSSALPRITVKYDLNGDNKHVFDLNYGQFRGTIGQGAMGGNFTRRPNNQTQTMYWNEGAAYSSSAPTASAHLVSQATLLNLANYKVYSYGNTDAFYDLDPNLKPENRESITLNYKRAFTGGFFRVSLIMDKFHDLWYAKADAGLPSVEVKDWSGVGLPSRYGYHQILTTDPYGKRDYRSLEMEWQQELSKGDKHLLLWNGNWTMSRTRSTQTWREGNVASSNPTWYEQWQAAGVPMDAYNPYGELAGLSQHHNIKTWLSLQIGAPKGVQNSLTLLFSYFSGYPFSLTQTMNAPQAILDHSTQLQTVGTGTTASYFINGARGQFLNQDSPTTIDLQWNMSIPVPGSKVTAFTALTVYNVFNHFNRTTIANRQAASYSTNPTTGAAWTYPNVPSSYWGYSGNYYALVPGFASGDYTYNSGFRNARNWSIDMGFRF